MSSVPAPRGTEDRILTVAEITELIRGTLQNRFPAVWVRGEISGCRRHTSGHLYFSLKDGGDVILAAVMFRMEASRLRFEPRDGVQVEAFGRIEVYAVQGKYQLVVREMRPAGLGARQLALEELKRKLQAEGVFDIARKRPLPRWPRRIGLVTSPVGAAIRDLVKVARARWPSLRIVLAPVRVQGDTAAAEIAAAIRRFNRYGDVDLLIVGRGGGSAEDLWAFNEEIVVRAIADSQLPVVSAVGHEVDVTLADLAADVRAATPSNAAEIAVPSRAEAKHRIEMLRTRLTRAGRQILVARRGDLERLQRHYGFQRHGQLLDHYRQRVDQGLDRATRWLRSRLAALAGRVRGLQGSYVFREFPRRTRELRDQAKTLHERLVDAWATDLAARRMRLTRARDQLRALSPRLVMERGYCLVRGGDGRLLRDAAELAAGDLITVEFARGEADARVETVREGGGDGQE